MNQCEDNIIETFSVELRANTVSVTSSYKHMISFIEIEKSYLILPAPSDRNNFPLSF